jgi:hypothetical protein
MVKLAAPPAAAAPDQLEMPDSKTAAMKRIKSGATLKRDAK